MRWGTRWRGLISPLYGPGRSRGFSNEESIHTAPIQLTLSANPLSAPSLPPRSSFLPFFLSSRLAFLFAPLLVALVRQVVPSTSRLRRATSAKSLLRARERGHVRHLPLPRFFFPSFLRSLFNPFSDSLSLSILNPYLLKTKIRIFQSRFHIRRDTIGWP